MAHSTHKPNSRAQSTAKQHAAEATEHDLRADLHDLADNASQMARAQSQRLKDAAGDYMEQGRDQAHEFVDHGRDMAAHYIEEGRTRALRLERTLEDQIREQPLRAIFTAAGVGFILGIFFSRR